MYCVKDVYFAVQKRKMNIMPDITRHGLVYPHIKYPLHFYSFLHKTTLKIKDFV